MERGKASERERETYWRGRILTIDVIVLDKSTPIPKDIHATLQAIVDLIPPNGGIAVGGDPHTSILIGVNLVLDELAHAVFMDVDATRLAIVDLTAYYGWVGLCLHFKASNAVIVYVIGLKVTLQRGNSAS